MALRLDPALPQALTRGATLLTPTRRAARAIQRLWAGSTPASAAALFAAVPQILPLEAWLAALWHARLLHGDETRILLNPTQEHGLWREILAADLLQNAPTAAPIRQIDALAETASRAWTLLCRYNGRDRLRQTATPRESGNLDTRAFERWTRTLEHRLTRDHLLTAAELPTELARHPQPALPAHLTLVDFDTLQPEVEALLETLEQSGTHVNRITTGSQPPSTRSLIPCPDDRSELEAAALWARDHRRANPEARLAIVVPNLADRRAEIARVFLRILAPEHLPITSPEASPELEFSLGRPLAGLSIGRTALDLLLWPVTSLPLDRIGTLLLSDWFTGSDLHAAEFDAFRLRSTDLLRPELTLDATIARAAKLYRRLQGPGGVLHRLRTLRKAASDSGLTPETRPAPRSFDDWSDLFRTLLDAAAWTAHAYTGSLQFQQHSRFETALTELATLDLGTSGNTPHPSFADAHATLTRILERTLFAPESEDAPVQVVGPLELGGVGFDALWFLGADDLAWPASPLSNPLLPYALQRALGLPGADRARDDAHALQLTRRIAQTAPEVVFSVALDSGEGVRRPSPLLAQLALTEREPAVPQPPRPLRLAPAADDHTLPPLPPERTGGGTSLLTLQAACGFRAFAEKRLFSTALDTPEPGLDARERGNLVHVVMEQFWRVLQTQTALRSLSFAERDAVLNQAIDAAFASQRHTPETPWDHAYLGVQRQRLHQLLRPWLDLEARRPPFTVLEPEQKQQFAVGPLTLSLRIDRMDQTPAGGTIVLDYKTGNASPADWEGTRPDAPQVPLYAVLAASQGQHLEGVAFAVLRAGKELSLKGLADDQSTFGPNAKLAPLPEPSLEDQIAAWRSILTALAQAFASGDARVDPKRYPKTCAYCGQRLLCRLDPARLAGPGSADDTAAEDETEELPFG